MPGSTPATRAATRTLHRRGRRRDRRHHRLRHGHRQARRALRGASRSAEEHRSLLPGDRPRRARWQPSSASMAHGLSGIVQQRHMINDRRLRRLQAGADRQARRARSSGRDCGCRRARLLGYFGETAASAKCGHCDNCLSPPQLRDGKVIAQNCCPSPIAPGSDSGRCT